MPSISNALVRVASVLDTQLVEAKKKSLLHRLKKKVTSLPGKAKRMVKDVAGRAAWGKSHDFWKLSKKLSGLKSRLKKAKNTETKRKLKKQIKKLEMKVLTLKRKTNRKMSKKDRKKEWSHSSKSALRFRKKYIIKKLPWEKK